MIEVAYRSLVLVGSQHEDRENECSREQNFDDCIVVVSKAQASEGRSNSQSPLTTDVPWPSKVSACSFPGNSPLTKPAAVMPPRIWLIATPRPLFQFKLPTRHIPNVIAGLNRALVMRKKTQALTASEKLTLSAWYSRLALDVYVEAGTVVPAAAAVDTSEVLATWHPARAKKRKKVVPMNSARTAMRALYKVSESGSEKRSRSERLSCYKMYVSLLSQG